MKIQQDDHRSDRELTPSDKEKKSGGSNFKIISLLLSLGSVAGVIYHTELKAREAEASGLIYSAKIIRDQTYIQLTIGVFVAIFGWGVISFIKDGMNKK